MIFKFAELDHVLVPRVEHLQFTGVTLKWAQGNVGIAFKTAIFCILHLSAATDHGGRAWTTSCPYRTLTR